MVSRLVINYLDHFLKIVILWHILIPHSDFILKLGQKSPKFLCLALLMKKKVKPIGNGTSR